MMTTASKATKDQLTAAAVMNGWSRFKIRSTTEMLKLTTTIGKKRLGWPGKKNRVIGHDRLKINRG